MHWQSPLAMTLKPARSRARPAAASWVSTSAQSWPSSIIRMTPPIWPCARRSRLITSASSSLSTFTPDRIPLGVWLSVRGIVLRVVLRPRLAAAAPGARDLDAGVAHGQQYDAADHRHRDVPGCDARRD